MGTVVVNGVSFVDPSPTGTVRWADIAATTSNSYTSLSQLRGKKWYKSDFTRGTFPSSPTAISFSSFRGTSGSLPRVDRTAWPAAGKFFFTGNITLPSGFNKISFRVYGAGGGGGGNNGADYQYNPVTQQFQWVSLNGGAGGTGGTTSIVTAAGTYSATGGGGGNQGSTGANGSPDPGAAADFIPGGTGNGSGGKGGRNYTTAVDADINWASASAMFSQTCSTTYGSPGAAGAGTGGTNPGAAGNAGGGGGITVMIDEGLY